MENAIMNAVTITDGKVTTTSLKIAEAVLGIPPCATRRVNQKSSGLNGLEIKEK